MAKKRLYVPVDDYQQKIINAIAEFMDRSDAYIASKLIEDGIKFNMLEKYTLNPSVDVAKQFKQTH